LEVADKSVKGHLGLVLDDIGQRAGGAGQGHVEGRNPVSVDADAVHKAEIDDVHAEFRVNDIPECFEHVLDLSTAVSGGVVSRGVVSGGGVSGGGVSGPGVSGGVVGSAGFGVMCLCHPRSHLKSQLPASWRPSKPSSQAARI